MASKREQRNTKKLKKDTQAVLNEKLAEMILLREDVEAQERFATELGERKALVQQLIDVTHQIQALRTVIKLFTDVD